MVSPMTKKEIRNVGYSRYLQHVHAAVTISVGGIVFIAFVFLLGFLLKGIWNTILVLLVGVIAITLFVVLIYKAEKAGKTFLVEWEKEHGVIQEEK